MAKNFREATLDDLLEDPLTSVIMRRDGVNRDDLTRLLRTVAAQRAASRARCEGQRLIDAAIYPLSPS